MKTKYLNCPPGCTVYHDRFEAAAILRCHPSTIYLLEKRGLRVSRKTGNIRIKHPWIDAFVEDEKTTQNEA